MSKKDGAVAIGFLTVVQHKQLGAFGGYLLLNKAGRPLEFHCTAPVRANRAQEILYGATLPEYLFGEVIGQTLVEKSAVKPLVVCTDRPAMLAVRPFIEIPTVQVYKTAAAQQEESAEETGGEAAPSTDVEGVFTLGFNRFLCHAEHASDREQVEEKLKDFIGRFDLSEPFTRIREAIKEAQQGKAA